MQIGKRTQRRLIVSVLFGILVFLLLAVFGDIRGTAESLKHFKWSLLPLIFGLALGNYAIRFVRWNYYLRVLHIQLPIKNSLTVFMSGLAMSITPGKMGEVVKSYFLKRMTNTPLRKSVPIIFAERFTDLFSIVALAGIGAFSFDYAHGVIWAGLIAVIAGLVVVMNRPIMERLIGVVSRARRFKKPADTLHDLYDHAYQLLRFRPLVIATTLGIVAWFCECLGFYYTLRGFDQAIGVWPATFIYAFATFVGAITFLPGGLGSTEASMTGLIILKGAPKDVASAATIITRIATLWFAVTLGLLWLAPNRDALIPDREDMSEDSDDTG